MRLFLLFSVISDPATFAHGIRVNSAYLRPQSSPFSGSFRFLRSPPFAKLPESLKTFKFPCPSRFCWFHLHHRIHPGKSPNPPPSPASGLPSHISGEQEPPLSQMLCPPCFFFLISMVNPHKVRCVCNSLLAHFFFLIIIDRGCLLLSGVTTRLLARQHTLSGSIPSYLPPTSCSSPKSPLSELSHSSLLLLYVLSFS